MTIDGGGNIVAFAKKPVKGMSTHMWLPSVSLMNPLWRRSALRLGDTKPPKNWRSEIYRLEREK